MEIESPGEIDDMSSGQLLGDLSLCGGVALSCGLEHHHGSISDFNNERFLFEEFSQHTKSGDDHRLMILVDPS